MFINFCKKILITSALCFFCISSQAQFDLTLSEIGLKSSVRSIQESEYQIDNNDLTTQKEVRNVSFTFNERGNKTAEKYTSPSGEATYHAVFSYTSTGELIEEVVNNFGHNKNFVKQYRFEPKKVTVKILYDGLSVPKLHAEYLLNPNKTVSQRTDYSDDGGILRVLNYTYAAKRLQSEIQQMQKNTLKFKYAYNAKNQLSQKTDVSPSGQAKHTVSYIYDNAGNVLSETSSYAGDANTIVINYKYTFDSKGNWIEKQESMNGNLYSVIKRKLEYY